jgi:hypothetical protein
MPARDVAEDYPRFPAAIPDHGVGYRRLTHPCATDLAEARPVRLACLIHAANVHSEPGSNPSKWQTSPGAKSPRQRPLPGPEGPRKTHALQAHRAEQGPETGPARHGGSPPAVWALPTRRTRPTSRPAQSLTPGPRPGRRLPSRVTHSRHNNDRWVAPSADIGFCCAVCLADNNDRPDCQRKRPDALTLPMEAPAPRPNFASPTDTMGRCKLPSGISPRPSSMGPELGDARSILTRK